MDPGTTRLIYNTAFVVKLETSWWACTVHTQLSNIIPILRISWRLHWSVVFENRREFGIQHACQFDLHKQLRNICTCLWVSIVLRFGFRKHSRSLPPQWEALTCWLTSVSFQFCLMFREVPWTCLFYLGCVAASRTPMWTNVLLAWFVNARWGAAILI